MFYIGEQLVNDNIEQTNKLDSKELILRAFSELLKASNNNYTFYVHNLGGYDLPFILRPLVKCGLYKIKTVVRDPKNLSVIITKPDKKHPCPVTLVDSYYILSSSLEKLGNLFFFFFFSDTKKVYFPIIFFYTDTLLYKGEKPAAQYWELNNDNNKLLYSKIDKDNWSTKSNTICYLKHDLTSLHQIMLIYLEQVKTKYGVKGVNNLTNSSLAMNIFLSKFHKGDLGLIDDFSLFSHIKKSYYGGINEVYKPTYTNGEILYYYDVNSLYPFSALNYMPGRYYNYEANINKRICFYGFYVSLWLKAKKRKYIVSKNL